MVCVGCWIGFGNLDFWMVSFLSEVMCSRDKFKIQRIATIFDLLQNHDGGWAAWRVFVQLVS